MQSILRTVYKSGLRFASGVMLSRLSGLVRDVLTAAMLGASKETALFFVAFRLANVFRRLLAETPLSAAIVPLLREYPRPQVLYLRLVGGFLLLSLAVVVPCQLLASIPSYSRDWGIVATQAGIMVPSLTFLIWTGINMAFLQIRHALFRASASQVLCNVIWILALPLAAKDISYLSYAVLFGFIIQSVYTTFIVFREYQFSLRDKQETFGYELKRVLPPFLLTMGGIAATQINSAIDPFFAKAAAETAPAYLWYAIRIYQLPLALMGIALTTASFPELAKLYAEGDTNTMRKLREKGVSLLLLSFLPIAAFLLFAAPYLVAVVYERGVFDSGDVLETARCLQAYGIGLPFAALTIYLSNAYYAERRYVFPPIASALSVIVNILLNAMFVFILGMGAEAVAFATAISSMFNASLLLQKREYRYFVSPMLGVGVASVLTSYLSFPRLGAANLLTLFFIIFIFGSSYLIITIGRQLRKH